MTSAEIDRGLGLAADDVAEAIQMLLRFYGLQVQDSPEGQGYSPEMCAKTAIWIMAAKLRGMADQFEENAKRIDEHNRSKPCRRPLTTDN